MACLPTQAISIPSALTSSTLTTHYWFSLHRRAALPHLQAPPAPAQTARGALTSCFFAHGTNFAFWFFSSIPYRSLTAWHSAVYAIASAALHARHLPGNRARITRWFACWRSHSFFCTYRHRHLTAITAHFTWRATGLPGNCLPVCRTQQQEGRGLTTTWNVHRRQMRQLFAAAITQTLAWLLRGFIRQLSAASCLCNAAGRTRLPSLLRSCWLYLPTYLGGNLPGAYHHLPPRIPYHTCHCLPYRAPPLRGRAWLVVCYDAAYVNSMRQTWTAFTTHRNNVSAPCSRAWLLDISADVCKQARTKRAYLTTTAHIVYNVSPTNLHPDWREQNLRKFPLLPYSYLRGDARRGRGIAGLHYPPGLRRASASAGKGYPPPPSTNAPSTAAMVLPTA